MFPRYFDTQKKKKKKKKKKKEKQLAASRCVNILGESLDLRLEVFKLKEMLNQ